MLNRQPPRAPPIHYLVAFEAAARCKSFKEAAAELNVTASAVSQQIKSLEKQLGLALFARKTRAIMLTSAGESFYHLASKTTRRYQQGFAQFKEEYYSPRIKISMFSYIANELVIPNLQQFQQACPDIELVIETSMKVENLIESDLDCALRFGKPPWHGCQHTLLSHVDYNILASRAYLQKTPFKVMADLKNHTIIHHRSHINDWQALFDRHQISPKEELFFSSYAAAIKAAEQGLGLAFGLFPTVDETLRAGNLVALLREHKPLEEAYYFISKANNYKDASYQSLQRWLTGLFQAL
ncbi:hypothetical protein A9Q90_01865 [Gammaproteobacteria bacterium 54_18_T64]|nr:hypothetical protein A9Q90_01865 [Gammaproteobacteria bacterium 54_18_T64]